MYSGVVEQNMVGQEMPRINDIRRFAAEQGITLAARVEGATAAVVFQGITTSGMRVAVKSPHPEWAASEIAAMQRFPKTASAEVFAVNDSSTVYAAEWLEHFGLDATVADAVEVTTLLHRSSIGGFTDLREPMMARVNDAEDRYGRSASAVEARELSTATSMLAELIASTRNPVLLHGDLHQQNIIPTASGPRAIDPIPAVGDPLFDVAFFLACRGHAQIDRLLAQWEAVSSPRLDRWLWVLAVLERKWDAAYKEEADARNILIARLGEKIARGSA